MRTAARGGTAAPLIPLLPGAGGGRGTGGKGENPPALPRGNRVALRKAGLGERDGGGWRFPSLSAEKERWALAFEILAQSRPAFGRPGSLRSSVRGSQAAGCVGSPRREPGDAPNSGLGATARGEAACESRLGGPGGVCEA